MSRAWLVFAGLVVAAIILAACGGAAPGVFETPKTEPSPAVLNTSSDVINTSCDQGCVWQALGDFLIGKLKLVSVTKSETRAANGYLLESTVATTTLTIQR